MWLSIKSFFLCFLACLSIFLVSSFKNYCSLTKILCDFCLNQEKHSDPNLALSVVKGWRRKDGRVFFILLGPQTATVCSTCLQAEVASLLAHMSHMSQSRLQSQLLTSASPWQRQGGTGIGKSCWDKPEDKQKYDKSQWELSITHQVAQHNTKAWAGATADWKGHLLQFLLNGGT